MEAHDSPRCAVHLLSPFLHLALSAKSQTLQVRPVFVEEEENRIFRISSKAMGMSDYKIKERLWCYT